MEKETPMKQGKTKTDQDDTDKITTKETRTEQEETGIKLNILRLHKEEVATGHSAERNRYQTR